jgi:hypothetical protein
MRKCFHPSLVVGKGCNSCEVFIHVSSPGTYLYILHLLILHLLTKNAIKMSQLIIRKVWSECPLNSREIHPGAIFQFHYAIFRSLLSHKASLMGSSYIKPSGMTGCAGTVDGTEPKLIPFFQAVSQSTVSQCKAREKSIWVYDLENGENYTLYVITPNCA